MLGYCCELLYSNGFLPIVFKLDPRSFGSPQCRPRLYILLFPRSRLEAFALSEADTYGTATHVMAQLARNHGIAGIDTFLYPDTCPLITSMLAACSASGAAVDDDVDLSADSAQQRWPDQHYQVHVCHDSAGLPM